MLFGVKSLLFQTGVSHEAQILVGVYFRHAGGGLFAPSGQYRLETVSGQTAAGGHCAGQAICQGADGLECGQTGKQRVENPPRRPARFLPAGHVPHRQKRRRHEPRPEGFDCPKPKNHHRSGQRAARSRNQKPGAKRHEKQRAATRKNGSAAI